MSGGGGEFSDIVRPKFYERHPTMMVLPEDTVWTRISPYKTLILGGIVLGGLGENSF